MNNAKQNRIASIYQRLPEVFSVITVVLGVLVLFGWFFDLDLLKSGQRGLTAMKPNTATSFIFSGLSLFSIQAGGHLPRIVSRVFACLVLLLGLLTLCEYLSGASFGIDQWLIRDMSQLPGDIPGRMSFNSALSFSALGTSLLLLSREDSKMRLAIHVLTMIPILGAGAALIGYTFGIEAFLVAKLNYKPMAMNSAAAFLLLALGILNARAEYPFRRFMISDSVAGVIVRRLLPVTIGFTLMIGWLIIQGNQAGYFSETFALSLFTAASIAGLAFLILWGARTLYESDAQRHQAWFERRSASQYARRLIEASPDPLVTISAEGKITDVNEATIKATGVSRESLIGSDFSEYFTEPDKARMGYQEVFAKGLVRDYPLALRHVSGKIMEVLYNASLYSNDAGEVQGIFAAARDVTERNKAEAQVAKLSLQNKLILDSAGEGIYGLDNDGLCTFANPAAAHLLGFRVNELLGQKTHALFHHTKPDGRPYPEEECPVQAAYKQGLVHRGNDMYWRKDGSGFQVGFVSTPIQEDGKTKGAVVVFRDITELQRAEAELRRSEHNLAEAQRMAHLGSWELNLITKHLEWSDETFRIFEMDPENGASFKAFLDAIHPDDSDRVRTAYTASVDNKTPYDIVHRILMKDGRVKYIEERCETYYQEDGQPLRSIGTAHDITERILAENEIKALNRDLENRVAARTAELEETNAELESFAYSVSHDLRVPLRAIDGFSRIVLEDYAEKLDAEGQRLLNVVRDNTKKMAQLIDDILKFSRAGRLELTFAEVDMEKLAYTVFDELKPQGDEDRLQLEIGRLPPAIVDSAMMRQVFVNLLSNAIKFSRDREPARLKVGCSVEQDETVYYVKDNGTGFDMQYADKLFGVFQRLHGVEEFEGTGIGLAIVKRIVGRHGGRVWAEGKVNEGATFYFSLPRQVRG